MISLQHLNFLGVSILMLWAGAAKSLEVFIVSLVVVLFLGLRNIPPSIKSLVCTVLWGWLGYFCIFDVMKWQMQALITGDGMDIFWGDFPQNIIFFFAPGFIWLYFSILNAIYLIRACYRRMAQ